MSADRSRSDAASRWLDRYALLLPIGFTAATIGSSIIGLKTLLSVNLLTRFWPWMAIHGNDAAGHQFCSTDTVDSAMPGIAYARDQLYAGHIASWQGLVSGGGPLLSGPDLGLLNPLSIPYWILPLWLAPAFVKLLEFIVAIGGTYLFLRRLRCSRLASSMSGVVFASSGFMVVWTNWPQTRVAALIPPLFWAVERLIQRRRLSDVGLIAIVVASMIFGGFPSVTGYALYAAGIYLIVRLVARHGRSVKPIAQGIGLAALGLVLGAALTAVQLLPFAAGLGTFNLDYRAQTGGSHLPLWGLLTLVDGSSFGTCVSGVTRSSQNPIEGIAYIGAGAMVLAVIAVSTLLYRRRSSTGRSAPTYFIAASVVIVLLGWVGGALLSIAVHFPVFSNNFVGRIRSVLGLTLAALAAFGFDAVAAKLTGSADPVVRDGQAPPTAIHDDGSASRQLDDPRVAWRRWAAPGWFALTWVGVAAAALLIVYRARQTTAGPRWHGVLQTLPIPVALLAATIVLAVMSRTRHHRLVFACVLIIPALVVGQSAIFFRSVLPGDSPQYFYPVTGAHQYLAEHDEHERYDAAGVMYTATSLYYGLRTSTGHQFIEPNWASLLQSVDPKAAHSPTNYSYTADLTPADVANSPSLDRMGVKYFVFNPAGLTGAIDPVPPGAGTVMASETSPATCTLPATPLRGVSVRLSAALTAQTSRGVTVQVAVHDANNTIVSARYLGAGAPAGTVLSVAVPGEGLATSGSLSVAITVDGATTGLSLAGEDGQASCAAVHPTDDKLKLVYADAGSIIYQRLTALPRIRWASTSAVVGSPTEQLKRIQTGIPDDQVLLAKPGPQGSGQPATVSVHDDSGDDIVATVNASGAGYLVVADALQREGWSVTVDGKKADLRNADVAMVAVSVPQGTHTVHLHYAAPHQAVGLVLTILAAAAIIACIVIDFRRRGARQTRLRAGCRPHAVMSAGDSAERDECDGRDGSSVQRQ